MKMHRFCLVCFTCCACFGTELIQADQPRAVTQPADKYRIVEFESDGSAQSFALQINASGVAVGMVGKLELSRAAVWDAEGKLKKFPELSNKPSFAQGINDSGMIVGIAMDDTTKMFLIEQNRVEFIAAPEGYLGIAGFDINSHNQVCSVGLSSDEVPHAFLWQRERVTPLDTLAVGTEKTDTEVSRINDRGQVIGSKRDQAFLWSDGKFTNLGSLSLGKTVANDINNEGVVVGSSITDRETQGAFRWFDGTINELRGLDATSTANALAISNGGLICGCSSIGNQELNHAVVWNDDMVIDLNDRLARRHGFELTNAVSINDAGEILCMANRLGLLQPVRLVPLNPNSEVAVSKPVDSGGRPQWRDDHPFGEWDANKRTYENNYLAQIRLVLDGCRVSTADGTRSFSAEKINGEKTYDAKTTMDYTDFQRANVVRAVYSLAEGEMMEVSVQLHRLDKNETHRNFASRFAASNAAAVAKELFATNPPAFAESRSWISGRAFEVTHIDILHDKGVFSKCQYLLPASPQFAIVFDWSYTHPIVRDVLNANMVGMLQVGPNLSANVSLTPEVEHAHATAIQVIAKSFYDEGLALLKERRKSGYYRQAHAIRATARFIRGANDGDIGLFAGAERAGNFAGAGAAWADAIEAGTMTAQVEMQLFNLRREKAIEQLTDAQRAELQSVKHELLLGNQ